MADSNNNQDSLAQRAILSQLETLSVTVNATETGIRDDMRATSAEMREELRGLRDHFTRHFNDQERRSLEAATRYTMLDMEVQQVKLRLNADAEALRIGQVQAEKKQSRRSALLATGMSLLVNLVSVVGPLLGKH